MAKQVQLDPDVHARAKALTSRRREFLNAFVTKVVRKAVDAAERLEARKRK